jgi:hypothetical protein
VVSRITMCLCRFVYAVQEHWESTHPTLKEIQSISAMHRCLEMPEMFKAISGYTGGGQFLVTPSTEQIMCPECGAVYRLPIVSTLQAREGFSKKRRRRCWWVSNESDRESLKEYILQDSFEVFTSKSLSSRMVYSYKLSILLYLPFVDWPYPMNSVVDLTPCRMSGRLREPE